MRRPCGHLTEDVDRGWSFAWRVGEGSFLRMVLAVLLAVGLVGILFATMNLMVVDRIGEDGRRLGAAWILTGEQFEASGARAVLEAGSPPTIGESDLVELNGVDEYLERLGESFEEEGGVEYVAVPDWAEGPMDWRPVVALSLPERERVEVSMPVVEEVRWVMRLEGEGELGERVAGEVIGGEWVKRPVGDLEFAIGLDERGRVLFATLVTGRETEETAKFRRALVGHRFGFGEGCFGTVSLRFEEGR
ncbi:MAG: hypothetical protein AAGC74_12555 [Verrucomicrobiota bacterium]